MSPAKPKVKKKRPRTKPRTALALIPDAVDERTPVVVAICAQIATGTVLVKDACLSAGISRDTLHRWTREDPTLSDAYARAREDQAHAMAEQCIAIADGLDEEAKERLEAMVDAVAGEDDDWKREQLLNALTASAINRDRLRLDARKWLTSKIAPRVYGDRQVLEHDVSDKLADVMRQAEERLANAS